MATVKICLVVALAAASSAVSVPPAHAGGFFYAQCGNTVRMCLHYNSGGQGAEFGSDSPVQSFNPAHSTNNQTYIFMSGGQGTNGNGLNVWNNAGSGKNWHTSRAMRVYANSFWKGLNDYVPPGSVSNLPLSKNNDASLGWA